MSNYGNAKELSTKVMDGMNVYADMLGAPDESKSAKYGFVPGLGMTANCAVLDQQMAKLQEGVFQVLFTGGFSAGKSTLLNALMRKDVLRMSINAETAIITKIVFEKAEKIVVHLKDTDKESGKSQKQEMSIAEFFEAYRVDQDDPDKFKKVDYAVLQLEQEGIGGSMVQLVDSPGTQNSEADTKAARDFAKSADAIVYLINATMPFQLEDKEYIAKHFAGQNMQNLFFVVNRFDCVAESQVPELKKNVREQLDKVFTKADGSFDEALFNSRVFYTNAFGSMNTRMGQPTPIKALGTSVMIPDEITGVPQFEEALGRFLTDGGRDRKAFQSYIPRLAGMYLAAGDKIEEIMKVYQHSEEELVEKKEKVQDSADQYAVILDGIKDACRTCVAGILDDARGEYQRCVTRIDNNWSSHFASANVEFKFTQMIGLAFDKVVNVFNKDDAAKQLKLEARMKPLSDAVNGYVTPEMKKIGAGLETSINARLSTLQKQLDNYAKQMDHLDSPLSYEDIAKALMSTYNLDPDKMVGGAKDNSNLFQIILGVIAADPETISKGVSGGTSTTSAIMNTLAKSILEMVALYVVWWPIGIGMLAFRLVQMIREGKIARQSGAQSVLEGMRETTIAELRKNEDKFVMELENELSVITRGGVTMADGIQSQLDDYLAQVEAAIEALTSNSAAAAQEEVRTGKIKAMLLDNLKSLYSLLNGTVLTEDRIKEIAVNE